MGRTVRLLALAVVAATALPALAALEVLRGDDNRRLAIDPATIKRKGDQVSFSYVVDFRNVQGDYKSAEYRSLVVKAVIRCKARTIALRGSEGYTGSEGKGIAIGIAEPTAREARFQKIEPGTSDEDLWNRLCAPRKK
jgi:hypothetical protein